VEEEVSRQDREQRRRKIILQHEQTLQQQQAKNLESLIHSKLMRQSKQERRIAEQLLQVRNEKHVICENRIYREEQYTKQRSLEFQEAIDLEYELYEKARLEFKNSTILQMEQHRAILESKRQKRLEKSTIFCKNVVDELLNLIFKVVDYRTLEENKTVPMKKMREWKILFANNVSLFEPQIVPLVKDFIPKSTDEVSAEENASVPHELPEAVKLLDHQEFLEYTESVGFWSSPNSPYKNDVLVNVIEDISQLSHPSSNNVDMPELPSVALTVCVIGKMFSGKEFVTGKLAAKYGLDIIKVNDLVKDAIRFSNVLNCSQADITVKKIKDGTESKKDTSKLTKQQIGAKMRLQLMEGQSPDDLLIVDLIVITLSQQSEGGGGWILSDFPNTREQAVLLERELTGYEDAKPIKKGDLKRQKESGKPIPRNKSILTY
jgi:hypothetical protein